MPPCISANTTSIRAITCTKVIARATKILEVIRRIWVFKVPLVYNLFCNHVIVSDCCGARIRTWSPTVKVSRANQLHHTTIYSVCSSRRSFGWSLPGRPLCALLSWRHAWRVVLECISESASYRRSFICTFRLASRTVFYLLISVSIPSSFSAIFDSNCWISSPIYLIDWLLR